MQLERAGVPTAVIISQAFLRTARGLARDQGFPHLRIAEIAHPVGAKDLVRVKEKADAVVAAVLDGLLSREGSLTAGSDEGVGLEVPAQFQDEIVTSEGGDDERNLLQALWRDGLPTVSPTTEDVGRAVELAGRDPDEVVGQVPPLWGDATVRKVAANAVMAGCRPEYLPVVLAVIEAITDPQYGLYHRQITTHAGAPLVIVNGPIAKKLEMNSRTGVFGPGWRANATIGRAVRLVLMNIGGAIPGVYDMNEHAHPGKYTYCIAESEEMSPWESLHVERGYQATDSVVTVVNAEAPHSVTDNISTDARAILDTCASTLSSLGSNNLYSQGEPILALGPEHADLIADDGWTKQDVKHYIYDVARQPWARVKDRGKSLGPNFPRWLETSPRDADMVPILVTPSELIVVVCGGAGGKSMAIPTAGRQSRSVSKRVRERDG